MSFETFPSGRRAPTWRHVIALTLGSGVGVTLGSVVLGRPGGQGWVWIAIDVLLACLASFALTAYLRAWTRRPRSD